MKNRACAIFTIVILLSLAGAPADAGAERLRRPVLLKAANSRLAAVCRTRRALRSGEIWKAIASKHIADQRKFSTSFISLRSTSAPRGNCLYGYDGAGNLVHKLGRYFPNGAAYSSRFYGGHGCGDLKSANTVAAMARRNTGSPAIYITSGTGVCAIIPNPARCYNSSGC